jgi:hypothetical protein
MSELCVVVATWDMHRALTRCAEMMTLERRKRAEYVIVVPKAENLRIGEWAVNGLDPEDLAIVVVQTDQYLSPVEAMALGARAVSEDIGVFAFLHDDCIMEQRGWDRVIVEFFADHPRCGLVGFGGGTGFAHDDIYKVPYDYRQLARVDFVSNMREAKSHGRRVTKPVQVAALDGFALIVTREFYTKAGYTVMNTGRTGGEWIGAWDACLADGVPFHCYDNWLSCRAAELGYEVWSLPIACHHQGGQTSVSRQTEYAQVVARLGFVSAEELYTKGHEVIYKRFNRVLPIRVPNGGVPSTS